MCLFYLGKTYKDFKVQFNAKNNPLQRSLVPSVTLMVVILPDFEQLRVVSNCTILLCNGEKLIILYWEQQLKMECYITYKGGGEQFF